MTKKSFELLGGFSETINALKLIDAAAQQAKLPELPDLEIYRSPEIDVDLNINPAKWTHERLGEYIKGFEKGLDNEHEIGARLVSFGQVLTFHIESVGYYGPDIIDFNGVNEQGERVQLIQHISQLNVLLVAMKKLKEKPTRIGYIWDKEDKAD